MTSLPDTNSLDPGSDAGKVGVRFSASPSEPVPIRFLPSTTRSVGEVPPGGLPAVKSNGQPACWVWRRTGQNLFQGALGWEWSASTPVKSKPLFGRILGLVFVTGSISLLLSGLTNSDLPNSDLFRFLADTPNTTSFWLLLSGIATAIAGGLSLLRPADKA